MSAKKAIISRAKGASPASWRRFSALMALCMAAFCSILMALVLWADPYSLRINQNSPAPVLMDSNQRFMYPQLVRSQRFDAAVIGTSSSRLLDPQNLSQLFGGGALPISP